MGSHISHCFCDAVALGCKPFSR